MPLRYSISKARNSRTWGLLVAGTENQNMLVNRANIEANIPVKLFLNANMTIGIIKRGLMYQLNTLWCLANAQLKNASLVINNTRTTIVAAAKNIPTAKSIFFFMISLLQRQDLVVFVLDPVEYNAKERVHKGSDVIFVAFIIGSAELFNI